MSYLHYRPDADGCYAEIRGTWAAPDGIVTEITNRTGSVYKVCCEGGTATQTAGGFYISNSPCTRNCTETLISE